MSLRINTNVTALTALRNLEQTSTNVSTSIERLSSGLRINRASDDPAGLIISEGLRAQIDGLNQAISNAQDSDNLIKTAEGGLSEINSLLRSVRQLAVHAANTGVNDAVAVQADQTQIASALSSIDRIASQTQFGTKRLLDGTSGVAASVTDTTNLGGIYIGGTFNNAATSAGVVNVDVTTAADRATVSLAAGTAYTGATDTVNSGGTIVLNGQSITVAASDTVQTVIDKINNLSGITKVGASYDTANDEVVLTQLEYGANYKIDYYESADILNNTTAATDAGANAVADVTIGGGTAVTFTGGVGTNDSGLRLTDSNGNSILLTEAGNTALSGAAADVAVVSANALQFQIGANAGQFETMSISSAQTSMLGTTSVTGKTLKDVNVTTAAGAADTMRIVDEAISQIATLRAQLGAFQKNTLESTIRFLGVGVENLSASESQVRDTNVAQEVVKLTKNQILQQAGTSVLAQANQAPQQVLSLLK